jgi:hypothetical protein
MTETFVWRRFFTAHFSASKSATFTGSFLLATDASPKPKSAKPNTKIVAANHDWQRKR